jgi:hypothetical protein
VRRVVAFGSVVVTDRVVRAGARVVVMQQWLEQLRSFIEAMAEAKNLTTRIAMALGLMQSKKNASLYGVRS